MAGEDWDFTMHVEWLALELRRFNAGGTKQKGWTEQQKQLIKDAFDLDLDGSGDIDSTSSIAACVIGDMQHEDWAFTRHVLFHAMELRRFTKYKGWTEQQKQEIKEAFDLLDPDGIGDIDSKSSSAPCVTGDMRHA